jgi:type II secretory pathway pseudopilin PulG
MSDVSRQMSVVRSHNGFTLVEVLLFLLLVLAMTTILLSSAGSLIKVKGVNLESIALAITDREIENIKNTAFAQLPQSGSFSDPDLSKLSPGAAATRTIADYQTDSQIKQVTVKVDWTENNVAKKVTVETLVYEYGP